MRGFFAHPFSEGWWHSPFHVLTVVWIAWGISWMLAALWTRNTKARAGLAEETPYRLVTGLGALTLFGFFDIAQWDAGWPVSETLAWAMTVASIAGFLFCWWARLTLGTLWSGTVTKKDDHHIIETGPYAFVRHPIYTGLIFSAFATAFARGRIEAIIGAILLTLGCWIKARLEERFLSTDLGAEYEAYRKRVKMLVPFIA